MLSLQCLHSWILITVFLLFRLVIFCHSLSCALGTVWEKISKDKMLKMLLDLKHTKKKCQGLAQKISKLQGSSAWFIVFLKCCLEPWLSYWKKKRMLLDFIILEKLWNFLRKEKKELGTF